MTLSGARFHITGIIQGVGFRPFVYGLAVRLGLKGWVRNTSAGVDIQVDGPHESIDEFASELQNKYPPLARIDSFQMDHCAPNGYTSFDILHSEPIPGAFIPISPDVSICDDCLQELYDRNNRRHLYPFINCTNCGPRFTIIKDIPYDRPKTTMAPFEMCPDCRKEYENPLDRRFHAQPVACPICGPHIWLEDLNTHRIPNRPITGGNNDPQVVEMVQQYLLDGKIVAIKGLGGFHLACDATNDEAVAELRRRKNRVEKPFALMMPDLHTVKQHCYLNEAEINILQSRERPVVLFWRKPESQISLATAPNQETIGVMLPYTPLHYLLFRSNQHNQSREKNKINALVMTSGNLSEEPIAISNQDARERLSSLADIFLMHNRDIHTRCDDSVVRLNPTIKIVDDIKNERKSGIYFLRRSRGYSPNPIHLPWKAPPLLATGPEIKNTFCLTKDNYAFISHHIGDMENYETLRSFEDGIEHFEKLYRITPEAVCCDLHPDYLTTRYANNRAQSTSVPMISIQHHHAHIAACMVDNGLTGDRPVIGVSLDGTGYGDDGCIWGSEFLIADYYGYKRFAHLEYFPLPGGDAGIKNPYRIALSQLWQNDIDWDNDLPPVITACGDDLSMLRSMLEHKINTPLTSSMGRLFDTIAALIGIRDRVNYEAQAAIELEAIADTNETGYYSFELSRSTYDPPSLNDIPIRIGVKPVLMEVIDDLRSDIPVDLISGKFHNSLANVIVDICKGARNTHSVHEVALSGGVWQNITLLNKTVHLLNKAGFTVYTHQQVPANDGGLSLGQAAIAINSFENLQNPKR